MGGNVVGETEVTETAPTGNVVAAAISALACGRPAAGTDFGDTLRSIGDSVVSLTKTLNGVVARGGDDVTVLAPYLARSLLEVGLTGVIGRLDPFRVLSLRKVQATREYDLGRRANSAVQWFGDIHTKDGMHVRWDPDKKPEGFSRALLDACWSEIAWTGAFERAIAAVSSETGDWFAELRTVEPKSFVAKVRGQLIATYSALSKGVHNEFVVDRSVVFDSVTVAELVSAAIKYLAWTCFVSHFIDHSAASIALDGIVDEFKLVEGAEFS